MRKKVVAFWIDRQLGNITEAFTLDIRNARFREAPDGTPYVVFPSTSVVMLRSGGRVNVSSPYRLCLMMTHGA